MVLDWALKDEYHSAGGRGEEPFWQRDPKWQTLRDVKPLQRGRGREADVPSIWKCLCFNCDFGKVTSFPYKLISN